MVKKLLKRIGIYAIISIILLLIFTISMIGTYLLPNTKIRENVSESTLQLKKEGIYHIPFFSNIAAQLDNFTDTLILSVAINKGMYKNESDIISAVENSHYYVEGINEIEALETNLKNNEQYNNTEYSRYWHGIQTIIRPLLMFFNYTEIRYIMMVGVMLLLGITASLIAKQIGTRYAIALFVALSMMYITIIPMSLQYTPILCVALLATIATLLLYKYEKSKLMPILMFITGACSAFFDLLTYPLITFGFPIVISVLLENKKEGKTIFESIKELILLCVLWAIGYGISFVGKWVIASIILQKDAITPALDQILFRVNGNEVYAVDRLGTLQVNFTCYFEKMSIVILSAITILWGILLIFFRRKIRECKVIGPLILISIIPYLWYFVFAGHSSIHAFFTHRIQAITVFAYLSILGSCIRNEKSKREEYKWKR